MSIYRQISSYHNVSLYTNTIVSYMRKESTILQHLFNLYQFIRSCRMLAVFQAKNWRSGSATDSTMPSLRTTWPSVPAMFLNVSQCFPVSPYFSVWFHMTEEMFKFTNEKVKPERLRHEANRLSRLCQAPTFFTALRCIAWHCLTTLTWSGCFPWLPSHWATCSSR
jgi:hypothetical protein